MKIYTKYLTINTLIGRYKVRGTKHLNNIL